MPETILQKEKFYLGYDDPTGMGGKKTPCLVRGIIGVNIDPELAKDMQLREVSKDEWRRIQGGGDA